MSQENVELVREAWDAWLRRDLDTLVDSYMHPEVVFDMTHFRDWPDRMYRGREGFARFLVEWLEMWQPFEDGVDDVLAAPMAESWSSPGSEELAGGAGFR